VHLVRRCRSVADIREALAECADDQTLLRVLPGLVTGIVSFEVATEAGDHAIITLEDETFEQPPTEDIVHAHDEQDFHGHTLTEYKDHPAMDQERLPPF
jgi:hypothetical protein